MLGAAHFAPSGNTDVDRGGLALYDKWAVRMLCNPASGRRVASQVATRRRPAGCQTTHSMNGNRLDALPWRIT
jgi:hypothetical protein